MSAEIEFDDKEVKSFLSTLKVRLNKIKDGNKKYSTLMSAIVYRDVIDHFENEMGSQGKWEHWSFWHTLQMERLGKGGNKILQDSGKLRQSFTPQSYRSISDGILWFNNANTKGGFPYAFAHNEGGEKLPKRDFMWASDEAMEKVSVQTLQFILDEGI